MTPIIVYHGTSRYGTEEMLRDGLQGQRLCTTTAFEIAALFALRRSPPSLLHGDETDAGRVIEFLLSGREGLDWERHRDLGVLQDEKEIRVYNFRRLTPVAVWHLRRGEWCPIGLIRMKSSHGKMP